MSDIVIKVDGISKVYKLYNDPVDRVKEALNPFRKKYHHDFYALKDVSFELKRGETVGIIGKNGSGKSTLLKILTGVLTPSAGSYHVKGKISSLLELGTGFNMELSGLENVYFNGSILGYTKEEIDEKLEAILEFADIGEFIGQPVKTYSSGMSVRLAFAVAISVDPDVLIVDEALAVGDMFFQQKCFKKFKEFQDKGKTILFVTHDLNSIIRYCNKGIVLNDGVKMFEGESKEVVDFYKKLFSDCCLNQPLKDENTIQFKNKLTQDGESFKSHFRVNKNALIYGNMDAEIIDFGVFDSNNEPVQIISNNEEFYIGMVVKFNKKVANPIFAYTIKDLKGMEITGTNTICEGTEVGNYDKGDVVFVEFSQRVNLQVGQYALSLGCTKYSGDKLMVFHRLYDILLFEVISNRQFVGLFDLYTKITLSK